MSLIGVIRPPVIGIYRPFRPMPRGVSHDPFAGSILLAGARHQCLSRRRRRAPAAASGRAASCADPAAAHAGACTGGGSPRRAPRCSPWLSKRAGQPHRTILLSAREGGVDRSRCIAVCRADASVETGLGPTRRSVADLENDDKPPSGSTNSSGTGRGEPRSVARHC